MSFSGRSQQIEVLVSGETLFQRSVAIGFVSTEDSFLDCLQHAPKRTEVVFASGCQSGLPQKGKRPISLLGNDVQLHAVKEMHLEEQ